MSGDRITDMLLKESEPMVPASAIPRISQLTDRVGRRRRQRKMVGMALCGATGLCMATIAIVWVNLQPGDNDTLAGRESVVDAPPSRSEISASPQSVRQESDSFAEDVQVFATVYQRIPIFGRRRDSEQLHHVGWIDSEQVVPVDVSQFPSDQQKNFQAVLNESDKPEFISL